MANGFSDKEMIQMVLDGQSSMNDKLGDLLGKINAVMQDGCAHRPDDMRRTANLEKWLSKALAGLIGSLGVVIVLLITILSRKLP